MRVVRFQFSRAFHSSAAVCRLEVVGPEFLLEGRMSRCQGYLSRQDSACHGTPRGGCQSMLTTAVSRFYHIIISCTHTSHCIHTYTYLVIFIYYFSCFITVLLAIYWDVVFGSRWYDWLHSPHALGTSLAFFHICQLPPKSLR